MKSRRTQEAESRQSSKLLYRRQYEAFRKKLIAARKSVRMTQRDVAKRLGRSQSYVAASETGERRVDVVELREFAKVYRKRIGFFFS